MSNSIVDNTPRLALAETPQRVDPAAGAPDSISSDPIVTEQTNPDIQDASGVGLVPMNEEQQHRFDEVCGWAKKYRDRGGSRKSRRASPADGHG